MVYIGIDPGKNGGLAWIKDSGKAECRKLDNESLPSELRIITCNLQVPSICYLEDVHTMPGQGLVSSGNFMKSAGKTEGILMGVGIRYVLVSPQKWKRAMKVTSDKQTSIDRCKELFPDIDLRATARCKKDHDGMAEALLIAEYGRTQCGY